MKYKVNSSSKFQKDLKRIQKRGYSIRLIKSVISILANGETLPEMYKDHSLSGDYSGYRECRIAPDWLLIYRIHKDSLILVLTRTGTHSDLF